MSFTNSWNEALPTNENFGYEIDDYIRDVKTDLRERLAVQHQVYASEAGHADVGEHTPGECTIIHIGTKSTFPVPATTTKGCAAIATDEGNQWYYWNATAWAKVQEPVLITGAQAIAGAKTFADIKASADIDIGSHNFRAQTLQSDVVTGTSPLTVASTTKVTNLNADNADTLDGFHAAAYAGGESHTLPGGMIIKQGTKSCSFSGDTSSTAVGFAAAFPAGIVRVFVALSDSGSLAGGNCLSVSSLSVIGFNIRTYRASTEETLWVSWIAIGY